MKKKKLKPMAVKLGRGSGYQRLLRRSIDSEKLHSGCVVLKPGESVGEHSTDRKEELIVVLEGKARVSLKGRAALYVEKNSVVYIPEGVVHNVRNTSRGLLRYVYVVTPVRRPMHRSSANG